MLEPSCSFSNFDEFCVFQKKKNKKNNSSEFKYTQDEKRKNIAYYNLM